MNLIRSLFCSLTTITFIKSILLITVSIGVSSPVYVYTFFFEEDLNYDASRPLTEANRPNTSKEQKRFMSSLVEGVTTEEFELFANSERPRELIFSTPDGPITAKTSSNGEPLISTKL